MTHGFTVSFFYDKPRKTSNLKNNPYDLTTERL